MILSAKNFFLKGSLQKPYLGNLMKQLLFSVILFIAFEKTAWCQPVPLIVTGNEIVTSFGCTVILKGVDVDGLEFSPSGFAGSWPGSILGVAQESVGTWHSSIIRLPLNQDYWFGCGNPSNPTPPSAAAYQATVSSIVSYCSSQNAYVILDLHWSGTSTATTATSPCSGSGWGTSTAQRDMPDANAVTFWNSVVSIYGNNPAVLFDLYNEPHPNSSFNYPQDWQVWQSGGPITEVDYPYPTYAPVTTSLWTPGMQTLLSTVRSAGATNLCLAGGLNFCQDFSGISSYGLTGTGIVYSAHLYGARATLEIRQVVGITLSARRRLTGPYSWVKWLLAPVATWMTRFLTRISSPG